MIDYEAAANTAPSTSNDPFLEPDQDCKLLILDSKNFVGKKGNKYIIRAKVLEVTPTGTVASPVVGAVRVVMISLDPPKDPTLPDYGMQNLIAYAEGLNGGPIKGETAAEKGAKLKRMLGVRAIDAAEAQRYRLPGPVAFEEAMAIGMVVGNRTVGAMVGKPQHPFTYHNWYSIKQTGDEVMARKAALKAGQPIKWPVTSGTLPTLNGPLVGQ